MAFANIECGLAASGAWPMHRARGSMTPPGAHGCGRWSWMVRPDGCRTLSADPRPSVNPLAVGRLKAWPKSPHPS